MESIERQVNNLFKSGAFNKQFNQIVKSPSGTFGAQLESEVAKLKHCIEQHIESSTTMKSVQMQQIKDSSGYEIVFDETLGTLSSSFDSYQKNEIGAFMPLMRNEGFLVKGGMFKGIGAEPQQFIEQGIADYISQYGDNLKLTVLKNWDTQYTNRNETITSIRVYKK